MTRYGVVVHEPWEAYMEEYHTLKEARAEVRRWETMRRPSVSPNKVTLVRIMSEHEEGSAPQKEDLDDAGEARISFVNWAKKVEDHEWDDT